jgi:hypothetical protein
VGERRGHRVGGRLIGEVDRRLDVGEQVEEIVADAAEGLSCAPRHPVEGDGEFGGRLRVDDRQHRLRLHEVEPAGEEAAERELAAAGEPGAASARLGDDRLDEGRAGGKLDLGQRAARRPGRPGPVEDRDLDLAPFPTQPGGREPR